MSNEEENDSGDEAEPIKVVVVGDGAIGKTCLLISYTRNEFPKDYVPTVFENMTKEETVEIGNESRTVSLDMWDTAGQEEFDRMRPLSYRETDVFLLCFSVVAPDSFENLSLKWVPEIQHHQKGEDYKILLVGLKSDLRDNENEIKKLKELDQAPVPESQIREYTKQISAIDYIECSALTRKNVKLVFETAIKAFLGPVNENQAKPSGCCHIL